MAEILTAARERSGLNQKEVAKQIGRSTKSITRMETDEKPSIFTIHLVAGIVGYELRLVPLGTPPVQEGEDQTPLLVHKLAARARLLNTTAQKALLHLAELLPTEPPPE